MNEPNGVQNTPNKEEILAGMDAKASEAAVDLERLTAESQIDAGDSLRNLADWWEKWYGGAGHKRLGKVLLTYRSKGG